jgi:hypothetical protein
LEIKIIFSEKVEEIMTRSEWICNSCGESFVTKGKRDSHRERAHRQKTSVGIENQGVNRSENGKFNCKCGRNYTWVRSLQRHQKNCKDKILPKEDEDNEKIIEEGIHQLFKVIGT